MKTPRAPSKFTPERRKRIIEAVKAGNYFSVAARYAGIHPQTLRRWIRLGKKQRKGTLREFHDSMRQAQVFAEIRAVAAIQQGMKTNWRAAVTYLTRRYPKRWGPRDADDRLARAPATGESGPPVLEVSVLAEIARILDEIGAIPTSDPLPADPTAESVDPPPADGEAGGAPPARSP